MKRLIPYLFFLSLCCGWVSAQQFSLYTPMASAGALSDGRTYHASLNLHPLFAQTRTGGGGGGGGGSTTNPLTVNNSGSGAASGATFNGSSPVTISYNTVGAAPATVPLTSLATQAADTTVMNATGGSAAPTAVAMPTCTTGADLYNTTTHTWSCVSIPATPAMVNITSSVTLAGACVLSGNAAVVSTPGTSCTFSAIPGTYTSLRLVITAATSASAVSDDILAQLNADSTGGHYAWQLVTALSTAASGVANTSASSLDMGGFAAATATTQSGNADILFPSYASTSFNKNYLSTNGRPNNAGGTTWQIFAWSGVWQSTAAITSIKLFPSTGPNLVAGSTFTLYGIL